MNPFVTFMASNAGRGIRAVVGIVLILLGLFSVQGTGGIILAIVGVLLVAVGVFNICLFAPLFGAPLSGKAINEQK